MEAGILKHICISQKKGVAKREVPAAQVLADHGVEGDAHAGAWHRQVSLLALSDIDFMRARGLTLAPGAFGENLVIDGIDADALGIGSRLKIGDVLLEITQIGKVCHTRCAIYYTTGDCIMPRAGLFASVIQGGRLTPGLPVEVLERVDRSVVQAAVLTVSDRCAEGKTLDTAGPAVAASLRTLLDAHVALQLTVPDEAEQIAAALKDICDRHIDLIVTVGGTGIAASDVTPEATRQVLDRELPGLGESMRAACARITPNALLSRAIAGVRRSALILNVPGSLQASVENLEAVTAALPHALKMLRGDIAHAEQDAGRLIAIQTP